MPRTAPLILIEELATASHGHPAASVRLNDVEPPRPGTVAVAGETCGKHEVSDDVSILLTIPVRSELLPLLGLFTWNATGVVGNVGLDV